MNLPECSSQIFSNVLKISPFSHRIRVVSKRKKGLYLNSKFSARIISHVPKYFQICPNLFQAGDGHRVNTMDRRFCLF